MPDAILLPGSAADADFLRRAFAPLLSGSSVAVIEGFGGDAARGAQILRQHCDQHHPRLVVGVSLGAHTAALWAADQPRTRTHLVLTMPAWTGEPDQVAAMTAHAAQRLRTHGVVAELARLEADFGEDWVVAELRRAWSTKDIEELAAQLEATSRSAAPFDHHLQAIRLPTTVVAMADDPLHPLAVAQRWHSLIAHSTWAVVGRDEPATDVAVFGRRVLEATAATPPLP